MVLKIKEINDCCLFVGFSLKYLMALIFLVAINSLNTSLKNLTNTRWQPIFNRVPLNFMNKIHRLLSEFLNVWKYYECLIRDY